MATFERMFIVPKGASLELDSGRPMTGNRETWLLKISFEGKEDEETLLRLRDQIAKLVDPSWLGNQV